jgi:hypothetical protein
MKDVALPVEHELLAEKASSLARAGETLATALAALSRLDAELKAAPSEAQPALRQRRRELRDIAADRLWCLLVQRECIGLLQHEGMLREHRVPPEVRLLAGPLKRR